MAAGRMAPMILFLSVFVIAPYGTEGIIKAGSQTDVKSQICPSDNPFKRSYVRIKTFDGKYWHAIPSDSLSGSCYTDHSLCVKTRCCGSKPSVGQRDITEPGRRTIFKVHCERNMWYKGKGGHVVMFELLNYDDNGRSKYYLCNADDVSEVFPKHFATQDINNNFGQCMWILHQYRGSVVGLEPLVVWKWTSFDDNGYGLVRHGLYKSGFLWSETDTGVKVEDRPTPFFDDTYTLEMVPQECLDVTDSQKIQAAKTGATVAECEEAEDRCFMNNGWRSSRNPDHPSSAGPKCFYKKDTPCFQPNVASRQPCEDAENTGTPEKCATANANCCYDYARNTCYQALEQ